MRSFRKVIFWTHLTSGVLAGIVIFIMCVTGALLSFEKDIIGYFERDMRYVASLGAEQLPIDEILVHARGAKPDAKPSAIVIQNDPAATVNVTFGREGQLYVDPYTGRITGEGATGVRSFFRLMTDWHRWLAMSGENRPVGKAVTGASNLLFLLLAVSGVYIWLPRKFEWRRIKPVFWFRRGLKGKGRDFNWHNVIGFWTSLVLIVLTATAVVISYQWAGNLVYTLTGNEPPRQSSGGQREEPVETPVRLDPLFDRAAGHVDEWKSISLRLPVGKEAVFTIDEGKYWNIFGRSTLTLEAPTAEVAKWEPYGEQNSGRQVRSWMRFTHTGETGGFVGQFIGFVACIGGAFLVYTGFSLALRRFSRWRAK